jgi:hypothetical protein
MTTGNLEIKQSDGTILIVEGVILDHGIHVTGINDPEGKWGIHTESEGATYSVGFIGARPKKRS